MTAWDQMNRKRRLQALDEIEEMARAEVDRLADCISEELARQGVPFRCEIDVHLVVTDNRLDPRLDSNHG